MFPKGSGSPDPSSRGAYSDPRDPWLWEGPAWCSTKAILQEEREKGLLCPPEPCSFFFSLVSRMDMWGQRDSLAGRVFALHTPYLASHMPPPQECQE